MTRRLRVRRERVGSRPDTALEPGASSPEMTDVESGNSDPEDVHPLDPSRTASGRFRPCYQHNDTGRRGRKPKQDVRAPDLNATLWAILQEERADSSGTVMSLYDHLVRSLLQQGFKNPKVALALLDRLEAGAEQSANSLEPSPHDAASLAAADEARIAAFLARQERRRRLAGGDASTDEGGTST